MIGSENWQKALENSTDGYQGAMKSVMSQISDDTVSMYSDWVSAVSKLDFVSLNGSGDIVFDFEKMSSEFSNTEEMVAGIAEKLGLSKTYVEAMIVDMSTFSSEFRLAYE
jgi:hypothetical protein